MRQRDWIVPLVLFTLFGLNSCKNVSQPLSVPSPPPAADPAMTSLASPQNASLKSAPTEPLPTVQPGKLETKTVETQAKTASTVQAELQLGFGQLSIAGGSNQLMQGQFTYNRPEWKPQIEYTETNNQGRLLIKQPQFPSAGESVLMTGNFRNEWFIRFGQRLPIALKITGGAVDSAVDLSGVNLKALDIQTGSGRVSVQTGPQTLDAIYMQTGAGDVDLKVPGGSVNKLWVEAGAGNIVLDLQGDWRENLEATIQGMGNVVVKVPSNVGVRLEEDGMGSVDAGALLQSENGWVNAAYGRSPITLSIKRVGMGNLTITTTTN